MHAYTVPRPFEANHSYFPSVLFDSTASTFPTISTSSSQDYQPRQPYHQHQLPSYDITSPEWCTTPHGLITPPQFNISFPTTTTNTYIQPPAQYQYQQPQYQPQEYQQQVQYQPRQPQQQYQQQQYQSLSIPSPPMSDRRSSLCSLPSPVPISRPLAQNMTSLFAMNFEQPSTYLSLPLSRSAPSPSTIPIASKWIDSTAISPKTSIVAGSKMAPRGSITFETTEKSCTPFISKLMYLLENPQLFGHVIRWDPSGTSFLLTPGEEFTEHVLPNIFAHSSIPAFTRQLNTYNFIRINKLQMIDVFKPPLISSVPLKHLSAWYHPNVTRSNPSTLNRMSPKQSKIRNESGVLKRGSLEMEFSNASSRMTMGVHGESTSKRRKI